jgi:hypothetical protein
MVVVDKNVEIEIDGAIGVHARQSHFKVPLIGVGRHLTSMTIVAIDCQ